MHLRSRAYLRTYNRIIRSVNVSVPSTRCVRARLRRRTMRLIVIHIRERERKIGEKERERERYFQWHTHASISMFIHRSIIRFKSTDRPLFNCDNDSTFRYDFLFPSLSFSSISFCRLTTTNYRTHKYQISCANSEIIETAVKISPFLFIRLHFIGGYFIDGDASSSRLN